MKIEMKNEIEMENQLQEYKSAMLELAGTIGEELLLQLGSSPIELTQKKVEQIKRIFPIPKEQCILWADVEFDLRPSGIVVTNRGVYIRSDASAFSRKQKAMLYFYSWEIFNPKWFIGEDESNKALQVGETCTKHFIPACKKISVQQMNDGYEDLSHTYSCQKAEMMIKIETGKSALSGSANSRRLSRVMNNPVLGSALTYTIYSVPETYNLITKKISTAQYVKNMYSLSSSIVGGAGGTAATGMMLAEISSTTGTAIAPGVGTVIGAAGGFVGGVVGATAANMISGIFKEDDIDSFTRMFNAYLSCMICEYLMDEARTDLLIHKLDSIDKKEFKSLMEATWKAKEQEKVIRDFLEKYFEDISEMDLTGGKMIIRRCTEADIVQVGQFYDRVVRYLCENVNYPKWEYKVYPSEEYVRKMTQVQQQFICRDNDTIVGAFVLNDDPQGKYENAKWRSELTQGEYMVCHTLATDPMAQGKGIGKFMVEYCINYARNQGYKAIRLDVVPENIPARKLYEKCGFQYVGDVDLERNIEEIPMFSMYELYF